MLRTAGGPQWERLRGESAFGLSNAVVPPPLTAESGALTLGAGARLRCPANLPAVQLPAEDRFLGEQPVPGSLPLLGSGLGAPGRREFGSLGGACRTAYLGPANHPRELHAPGYLAAMDSFGYVPIVVGAASTDRGAEEWPDLARAIIGRYDPDLLVVDLPPGTRPAESVSFVAELTAGLDPIRDLILLTSPNPGIPDGGEWSGLAPVLIWNWRWHGQAISSNSTRTRGLIANIDVAPTLLEHLEARIPPTVRGHAAHPAGAGSVESALRFALGTRAAHEATVPLLIGWGAFAFLCFALAVAALMLPTSEKRANAARFALTWAAAFIPAMLLAGVTFPPSAASLGVRVAALSGVLAGVAWLLRQRLSPVLGIYSLIVATVLADLFTGSHLLSRSLLGDFVFTGARFYGIGNEFEGLILGTSILAPLWGIGNWQLAVGSRETPPSRRQSFPEPRASYLIAVPVLVWCITLYAVAAPGRGADFGGAVSLGAGYAVGLAGLWSLRTGKRLRAGQIALAVAAVALVVAAMIGADLMRPAGARSHVGELAARTLAEGWGPLWEIALRKARMNLGMILSPYCLVSLAGVLPVAVWGYHKLDPAARSILTRRPLLRVGVLATLVGAVAGLLANDSGIVAWAFATGCALLLCLELLLAERAGSRV